MGNRLSKITTHTGDDGTTGLADGSRTGKSSARIRAIGDIDELNSVLGMVAAHEDLPTVIGETLLTIQHVLFDIGGELSLPGRSFIAEEDVQSLETRLEEHNRELPPLKEFILPGGTPAAAVCHLARTVCRRAERHLIGLSREEDGINPATLVYLNRLSDLLFVMARVLARQNGGTEICWEKRRR